MLTDKVKRRVHRAAFHANHLVTSYEPTIWLVGDGRSGTTWVSSLINSNRHFREMFEPFHPGLIGRMKCFPSHFYVRPTDPSPELEGAATTVFNGRLWHPRINQDNDLGIFRGLLVKDIFANLFAGWVQRNHPRIKVVLLIRNPFCVALSKLAKRDCIWVTDPMSLWNQAPLREDYLGEFERLIRDTSAQNDFILNQVLIWSIIHHIPFKQFGSDDIHVMFYEDVVLDPRGEMAALSSFVGKKIGCPSEELIARPSRMSNGSRPLEGSQFNAWREQIPTEKIHKGLLILERFGFGNLYGADGLPNRSDISVARALRHDRARARGSADAASAPPGLETAPPVTARPATRAS